MNLHPEQAAPSDLVRLCRHRLPRLEKRGGLHKSAKELDARVELSGHSAKEMTATFERFMASLYMTAMLQLGLMQRGKRAAAD